MKRRGVLNLVPFTLLAGCVSASLESNGNMTSNGNGNVPENIDRPVIDKLAIQYDDEWLMLEHRYAVPKYSDSFVVIKRWQIDDENGAEVWTSSDEDEIESDRETDVVLSPTSIKFVDRWANNIVSGEYTVKLEIEGPDGEVSEPATETASISTTTTKANATNKGSEYMIGTYEW